VETEHALRERGDAMPRGEGSCAGTGYLSQDPRLVRQSYRQYFSDSVRKMLARVG